MLFIVFDMPVITTEATVDDVVVHCGFCAVAAVCFLWLSLLSSTRLSAISARQGGRCAAAALFPLPPVTFQRYSFSPRLRRTTAALLWLFVVASHGSALLFFFTQSRLRCATRTALSCTAVAVSLLS